MKKNTKYLIASLACVAVLGAAALALVLTGGSEGEDTASSASDETITLLDKTQQDLESVTVTNEEGTITVLAHEETVESSSDAASSDASDASGTESESEPETEIVYEVEELEGLPFNTSDVDAIARAGYLVAANRSIGTVDDPEEFGLTDPTLTVEATFRDGSTFSYIVGVENNGAYYIQPEGSEEVYEYMICMLSPLSGEYEPGQPEFGFLYPAFRNRYGEREYINLFESRPEREHRELKEWLLNG